jgi:hypothetical protein
MKKFLPILVLGLFMAIGYNAQSQQMSPSGGVTSGGVTAAYLTVSPTLAYKCASFQVNVTRVSTAMVGTLTMQASNDGTNYVTPAAGDTIHVSDAATQYGMFTIAPATGVLYKYYRIKCVQLANDTATVKAYFNGRQ